MKNRPRTIRFALTGLLVASALAAGTLERARQLRAAGDLEGAGRAAAEAAAAATGEERAAALDLVGAIAVEARRWDDARAAWTRLAEEHPQSPLVEQARTKLALLDELGGSGPDREGDRDEPGAPTPPAAPGPPAAPDEPPADRDKAAAGPAVAAPGAGAAAPAAGPLDPKAPEAVGRPPDAARPAAPSPSPPPAPQAASPPPKGPEAVGRPEGATAPVPTAAPSPPSAPPEPASAVKAPSAPNVPLPPPRAGTAVYVAGDGKPREHFQEAAEQLMEFLAERGVAVREAPDGLAMLQDTRAALPRYLEAARAAGAASLLYFEAQFGHREKIEIECLTPDGAGLWSEKVTGGLGLSDRKVNKRLMNRFLDKLEPRIGGPGLPTDSGKR